jgi:hypothetical protein
MKIDVVYPDRIRLRFMFHRLPYALSSAIDRRRSDLVRLVKQATPAGQKGVRIEEYIAADGGIFSVWCALGKIRQDLPEDEPVQELAILRIVQVPGVHGIK